MKNIYPQIQHFLENIAQESTAPIYSLRPAQARDVLKNLQEISVVKQPAHIQDLAIPFGASDSLALRIYRPEGNNGTIPVVVWMHGGGWVLGGNQTHDRLMREISNEANAAVVFVDYTLAPEAQYPVIHEQCYAAAIWVANHGKDYNLDTSKIAIAGDSVGGQLATAVAMMAKERGDVQFIYQLLFYPVTSASLDTRSYQEFATGYWLERKSMEWFWDQYVPDKNVRKNPLVSPLQASFEELKGMPAAGIIVGENDVLRDEGEAYAHKLMQAGVSTVAVRYLGLIHDFALLNALSQVSGVRAAIAQGSQLLHSALYF